MKNILQILNYAAIYRGNFMESIFELDSHLKKRGINSFYLFPFSKEKGMSLEWMKEMEENNFKLFFLKIQLMNTFKLREIINKYKIGIVHAHFLSGKQICLIRNMFLGLNVKVVVHFHNHPVVSNRFTKKIFREVLYSNCKLIGVSKSVTKNLKLVYPKSDSYEVENAISFSRLDTLKEELTSKKFAQNESQCLIFGFDYKRKGVDLALDAIKRLIDSGEKIKLIISLSTNEKSVKQNIIDKFGEIPQWVECRKASNDVASLYRSVDLFISPSREEGFCYSIVEAAYCGCRIVASLIPAQKDLKVANVFWFENENVDDLCNSIRLALSQPVDMSITNELKKTYDLYTWAESVINVYESI